jgi:hypothetical protein
VNFTDGVAEKTPSVLGVVWVHLHLMPKRLFFEAESRNYVRIYPLIHENRCGKWNPRRGKDAETNLDRDFCLGLVSGAHCCSMQLETMRYSTKLHTTREIHTETSPAQAARERRAPGRSEN